MANTEAVRELKNRAGDEKTVFIKQGFTAERLGYYKPVNRGLLANKVNKNKK